MKSIVLTVFLTVLLLNCSAQFLTDSLLLYYPMNGSCVDMSGNSFDGTANADLTADHNGNSNAAYHFNGINQYINWPYSTKLQPQLPVSFAYWVKFDNIDFSTGGIFNTSYLDDNYAGFIMSLGPTDQINLSYGDASGGIGPYSRRTLLGNSIIQSNTWYFVIGIIRGPTDMTLYLNCENDGGTYSGTGGNVGYFTTSGNLGRVDSDMYGDPNYLGGILDEFRFWNRALDSIDIDNLCKMTDIADIPLDRTGLYPNPATDFLYLQNIPDDAGRLDVVSLTGEIIQSSEVENSIYIGNLKSGLYIIQLYNKEGFLVSTSRFLRM
ncbi:hypothetical protein SDC9_48608 [bioreactor metagenome]|uniref:Secretion system C-terminal sorting domain-containing protein n=1 Tax=bioreactor metagenome TaxID=1076179 RepID=A0A644WFU2_9ZZZZ